MTSWIGRDRAWRIGAVLAGILATSFAGAASASAATCDGMHVTIKGNKHANHLVGTSGDDVIAGGGGNDKIQGRGGNDWICGGSGNDRLSGGSGRDYIIGGGGNDLIKGGSGGNNTLVGDHASFTSTKKVKGGGNDRLINGDGAGGLLIGDNYSRYAKGGGDDVLIDGNGGTIFQPTLVGDNFWNNGPGHLNGGGDDTLRGHAGNEFLAGDNAIETGTAGGGGRDYVNGGPGDDILDGGPHRDRCIGGSGMNTFFNCP